MEGRRVVGWAARDASGLLSPYPFTLRFHSVLLSLGCSLHYWLIFECIHEQKNRS